MSYQARRFFTLAFIGIAAFAPAAAQTGVDNPLVKPPARPATQSGEVWHPKPTKGDGPGGAPGCYVAFTRGPGVLGPPCAVTCMKTENADVQGLCNSQPPHSWGIRDENGVILPWENARRRNHDCEVLKGEVGAPDTTSTFFPNGHPRCLGVRGDPHLQTFDGQRFDLQSAGEFVIARSLDDDFEVQARFEPYTDVSRASVTTAVAVKVGGYRVTVDREAEPPLKVDGVSFELSDRERIDLPDAKAIILRNGVRFSVVLSDDTNVHVDVGDIINFNVLLAEARDGRMTGIGGNGDGDRSNDFATADGVRFATPISHEDAHGSFAESWRVSEATSLFDYDEGEGPATFVIAGFPEGSARLGDLDLAARARAEAACRAAGLADSALVDECVIDLALTGDEAFIASALSQQADAPPASDNGAPEIIAPATAFAAHRVTIAIRGAVARGYRLGFSPEGGAIDVGNPYSAAILNGGETEVTIAVPTTPGTYELRYGDARGVDPAIVARAFESVSPQIEIDAPLSAPAGEILEATVFGDIGEHMQLVIVPAGADAGANGFVVELKQDGGGPVAFEKTPDAPGAYEIRCVSNWRGGRTVYASRTLTIE